MSLEIRLDDRNSKVELVSKDHNSLQIKVDDRLYELDVVKVEEGVYSILLNGESCNVEIIENDNSKKYMVITGDKTFDLVLIDADTRYLENRKGNDLEDAGNIISSPMPGKIVKIPVKAGQKVKAWQTVIIVSAMKMESEYKTGKDGIVKEVHVKEGDTIEGNQPLITIE